MESVRFGAFLSEGESFTEFLAGARYITDFRSHGQSETRFRIGARWYPAL